MGFLIILLSIFSFVSIICAENGTKQTVIKDVISTIVQLPTEQPRNVTYKIAFLSADDLCDNEKNAEIRAEHEKWSKVSEGVKFVGSLGDELLPGAGLVSEGIAFGIDMANAQNQVDSPELEYMKCFKEDFEAFKLQMTHDMRKIHKDLDNLRDDIEKGFAKTTELLKDLKKQIEEGMKTIQKQLTETKKRLFTIEKLLETIIIKEYQHLISGLVTLDEEFIEYIDSPTDMRYKNFLDMCVKLSPRQALNNIIIGGDLDALFQVPSNNNYAVLLGKCSKIFLDVVNFMMADMKCYAMLDGKADQVRLQQYWKLLEEKALNILSRMRMQLSIVKERNIRDVIPVTFKEIVQPACFGVVSDPTLKEDCRKRSIWFYEYLVRDQSWASFEFIFSDEDIVAISGQNTRRYNVGGTRYLYLFWCEHDKDVIRVENANLTTAAIKSVIFELYAPDKEFQGVDASEMVSLVKDLLASSPPIPNSPKLWSGIMAYTCDQKLNSCSQNVRGGVRDWSPSPMRASYWRGDKSIFVCL